MADARPASQQLPAMTAKPVTAATPAIILLLASPLHVKVPAAPARLDQHAMVAAPVVVLRRAPEVGHAIAAQPAIVATPVAVAKRAMVPVPAREPLPAMALLPV